MHDTVLETHRKQLRFDIKFAEQQLTTAGRLGRMFILHTQANEAILFPAPWDSDQGRDLTLRILSVLAIAKQAISISVITEAWIKRVNVPENSSYEEARRIARESGLARDAPDRREVVLAGIAWRDAKGEAQQISAIHQIERDEKGIVRGLGLEETADAQYVEIVLTRLLPPKVVPDAMFKAASRFIDALPAEILHKKTLTP